MPEEAAFLAALRTQPADDTTRLVYADWLDERGDVAKAAYLRLVAESRTRDDFGSVLPQIIAAGAPLDFDWRDAVASRFEIMYLGTAQNWEHHVLSTIEGAYRCNRVELAPLRAVVPAVLDDGFTPEAALRCVQEWTHQCIRSINPRWPRSVPGYEIVEASIQRVRIGDDRDRWFAVRPTLSVVPPVPSRFEVALAGRFDYLTQSHQVADVFAEPLRAMFNLTEDDARHLLYSCGMVPLRSRLSFAAALAEIATRNKALKRHTMARSLRELVSLDIRPESVGSILPPDGEQRRRYLRVPMFIFEKAPFKSCHASTVVEHEPGKLLAAWFGGTDEGAKDVQIWNSAFDGTKWSEPAVVGTEPGQPTWNPVYFKTAKGTLYLWYKAGPSPERWTGYVRKSTDNGKTWSKPAMMHAGVWGPVRAKPIQLANGTILAGTSVESHRNWTPFVDRSTDDGATWKRSNGFPLATSFGEIQPTLFEAKDGKIVALLRSRSRKICRAESKDGGETFSAAIETDIPNPSAGIDVVKTTKGDLFLIYNPLAIARTPISLARSTDDGATWKKVVDLETELGEFSYPAIIESAAGMLEITYTWKRTHIKYIRVDPAKYRA